MPEEPIVIVKHDQPFAGCLPRCDCGCGSFRTVNALTLICHDCRAVHSFAPTQVATPAPAARSVHATGAIAAAESDLEAAKRNFERLKTAASPGCNQYGQMPDGSPVVIRSGAAPHGGTPDS